MEMKTEEEWEWRQQEEKQWKREGRSEGGEEGSTGRQSISDADNKED